MPKLYVPVHRISGVRALPFASLTEASIFVVKQLNYQDWRVEHVFVPEPLPDDPLSFRGGLTQAEFDEAMRDAPVGQIPTPAEIDELERLDAIERRPLSRPHEI